LVRSITIDLDTPRITEQLKGILADEMASQDRPGEGGELAFRIFDPSINRSLKLHASRRIPITRRLIDTLSEENYSFTIND
ncbi:MAG: hypothetical protein K2F68_05800, partial [Duncaniella sp.]|nr:hypothetical protein [Duncaniella sp.]